MDVVILVFKSLFRFRQCMPDVGTQESVRLPPGDSWHPADNQPGVWSGSWLPSWSCPCTTTIVNTQQTINGVLGFSLDCL